MKRLLTFMLLLTIFTIVFASADIASIESDKTSKVWVQTNWRGDGDVEYITEDGIGGEGLFDGFFLAYGMLRPPGNLEVGITATHFAIHPGYLNPGGIDVAEVEVTFSCFLAAANIKSNPPVSRVAYIPLGDEVPFEDPEAWLMAPPFPPVGGDVVESINAIEVLYDAYDFQETVYAGVTMSGGYAGLYRADMDYSGPAITIGSWTYLEGPGNPADNPPTTACTDLFSQPGSNDWIICATGDSGVISLYDGSTFTNAFVGTNETVYDIVNADPLMGIVTASTGPNGRLYFGYLLAPYWQEYWEESEYSPFPSEYIYDVFKYGNYIYYGASSFDPAQDGACVYRGTSVLPPATEGNFFHGKYEAPLGVYSLGHIGNLIVAGTGNDGQVYGSRDQGEHWSLGAGIGENTDITSILDMGTFLPQAVFAGASGNYGGLYGIGTPPAAVIVSPGLRLDYNDSYFGRITWDVDDNNGISKVFVRTYNDEDMSDAPLFDFEEDFDETKDPSAECPMSGYDLNELSTVRRGDKYIQYAILLIISEAGESPIFEEIRIHYGSLGYDSLLPEDHITVSPNPIKGNSAKFYYELSSNAEVTVSVYDIKGRQVWTGSENGTALEPNQNIEWNTTDVAPGVYVYHVKAETSEGKNDYVTKKLAILK